METISKRLRLALSIRNMRQAELCALTGIGKSSISTYLSGQYEPKQKNLYKIAKALNVNESWLLGEDVPMERFSTSEFKILEDSDLDVIMKELSEEFGVSYEQLFDIFLNGNISKKSSESAKIINKTNLRSFFASYIFSQDKQRQKLLLNYEKMNNVGKEQLLYQSEMMLKSGMFCDSSSQKKDDSE